MPAALTSPPFRVHPAKWVPTLYFAEGLPFFSVATIAALMFKSRGASVAYGGLLGVFLLGVLTKRARQTGAIIGMICGLALNLYIWLWTKLPLTWYVTVGTLTTFGVGYLTTLLETDVKQP